MEEGNFVVHLQNQLAERDAEIERLEEGKANRTTREHAEAYQQGIEKGRKQTAWECIRVIESYQIPVGNSAAGELACSWTYDALKEVRASIKANYGLEG